VLLPYFFFFCGGGGGGGIDLPAGGCPGGLSWICSSAWEREDVGFTPLAPWVRSSAPQLITFLSRAGDEERRGGGEEERGGGGAIQGDKKLQIKKGIHLLTEM